MYSNALFTLEFANFTSVQFTRCECERTDLNPNQGKVSAIMVSWGRYPGRGQMSGHVGQLLEDHPAAR